MANGDYPDLVTVLQPYSSGTVFNAYDDNDGEEVDEGDKQPASGAAEFSSGALRSEVKLPFWRLSRRALIEEAKRCAKGEKYDERSNCTHNWKLAQNSNDVAYVREFYNHAVEHLLNARDRAQHGPTVPDAEGENMFDHLGAAKWNIAALIDYLEANPELVCRALSQVPTIINPSKE